MKRLFKFLFVAVCFMAAILVNVSINANKEAGDTKLVGFASEANAGCETNYNPDLNTGRCIADFCHDYFDSNACSFKDSNY